ncbi:tyrosine-type recombinase/integrase [Ectothiorhodospira variabilis]|uniref:tyrosine-type recombinase/integrase n=1 Tax=Ectothiorhodospira variabilis TaxID=505694 RepID=UPI001EFAA220|nr:site-specific integrase [Ectothiorhodospira variabilis]MCG5496054.1 site-specific integrase [Ectothiorhodospira variabilis]MCG5504182.1 site-specific integrase [Ectothiorhodospira variabilis]MCG5507337.1 site-specific integrase [Ectothiorhodospira variabilis]
MHTVILIKCKKGYTVKDLFDLHVRETILRPESINSYRTAVRAFVRDYGDHNGDIYISDVTKELVLNWRQKILKKHAPTTWNTYRTAMCCLFSHGVESGWIAENPIKKVKAVRVGIRPKRTISQEQRQAITEFLEKTPDYPSPHQDEFSGFLPGWFWLSVFKTLYFTGMRRRQLVNLRWKDIDFDREIILLSMDGSKTNREWSIPMFPTLHDHLQLIHSKTVERLRDTTNADLTNRQVFSIGLFNPRYSGVNSFGEIKEGQITNFFFRLSQQLGFRITAHGMRHTFATELMRARHPDVKAIQELLGHANINMTLEYMETDMRQLRRSMNSLPPM